MIIKLMGADHQVLKREFQHRKIIHYHLLLWLFESFNIEKLYDPKRKIDDYSELDKMAEVYFSFVNDINTLTKYLQDREFSEDDT